MQAWLAGVVAGAVVVAGGWLTWGYGPRIRDDRAVPILVVVGLLVVAAAAVAGKLERGRGAYLAGFATPLVLAVAHLAFVVWVFSQLAES